jgi:hypothetical protein
MKTEPVGITRFDYPPHDFDGYRVNRQRRGYIFRCYIPAKNKNFNRAYSAARKVLALIDSILDEPRNWRLGKPTRKAIAALPHFVTITAPK